MEGVQAWTTAWRQARTFLARWRDPATRNERDDLAQEAALVAWQQAASVRDGEAFPAMVRTIARRVRCRRLQTLSKSGWPLAQPLTDELVGYQAERDCFLVCGNVVDRLWLLVQLDMVLAEIDGTNRQLLLMFHEGFCCAELAMRFRLPEPLVKVRLYRTRNTVRARLEAKVRKAGCFEVVDRDDNRGDRR